MVFKEKKKERLVPQNEKNKEKKKVYISVL